MVGWQPGAHQPDRVAAAVIAFDVLAGATAARWAIVAPLGVGDPTSAGAGFADRVSGHRPAVDALMAAAARKHAGSSPSEHDDAPVVSMSDYVSRRVDGGGYDPLRGFYAGLTRLRRR